MRVSNDIPREVADQLEIFFAGYPQSADQATYAAYWLAVSDVPAELLGEAIVEALRLKEQWRPSPGVLRALAWRIEAKNRKRLERQSQKILRPLRERLRKLRLERASLDDILDHNTTVKALEERLAK